ncbi:ABC transporter ATP-binding protein [Rossellomorea sp. YZS02]|uniref:ABC transporter ATP-binding protein n=1 Tax=Rossellomorea sp. YZS02 TaxID=3097358 RepID=UPI002A166A39|nr:ABC transporter ATP-binding protein [Rossellomorea sp. YZS02]MDX8345930.1 ABC transporter ATP-binding protein [Rossellomorea sp. YZS02]
MSSFIEIQGLFKTFKEKEILTDTTLSLKKGEILSLVGASGSGKSTFLRILSGLESATKGKVLIEGSDISSIKPRNRPIGMVFQQPLLFPHMNVLENVMYGLKMKGKNKENKKRAKDYIERVGLGEFMHHYPSELSGGQQQRVSLIRSLILKPKLLLLDEPFSSLDLQLRKELRQWVRSILKEEDTTVLFVTHDRDEAYEMGDRVAVLQDGRFLQIGSPGEIYYNPASPFVASFMSDVLILQEQQFVHASHIRVVPSVKDLTSPCWKGTVRQKLFMAGTDIHEIWVEELRQKLHLPLGWDSINGTVWLYAEEENIRTFQIEK